MIFKKFELLITSECHWGCQYCCRGLDFGHPKNSHMTIEQTRRWITYMRRIGVQIGALKIDGGEPTCCPDLVEICLLIGNEMGQDKWIKSAIIYTAYPPNLFMQKFPKFPRRKIRIWSTPQSAPHVKTSHHPFLLSPADNGFIRPNEVPPFGSWGTKIVCKGQKSCGRCFSCWGFTASGVEAAYGRILGLPVFEKELKLWANPEVCRHCMFSVGRRVRFGLIRAAKNGVIPTTSPSFQIRTMQQRNELISQFPLW